jgi:outer membrane immunogenic protein
MRSFLLSTLLLLVGTSAAHAQDSYGGDAAASYHWVRTNAGPGDCGCFGQNGGELSGSWNFHGPWSVVVDFSAVHASSGAPFGNSLTLASFLAGVRYEIPGRRRIPQRWREGSHQPQPFAQILFGSTHAGGGVAGVADGSFDFSTRIGGGIDIPLDSHFAVRVVQIDYYLTTFPNATNDHQNNFLVGAGIVYRWSR